jgi:hypothetical protein
MERTKRQLTPAEDALINELYAAKARFQNTHAYVTTTEPLPMTDWNGRHPVEENTTKRTIPAGSTLKVVMVSRFGDCGLTDDLAADNGYGLRLDWEDAAMTDIRKTKVPTSANK